MEKFSKFPTSERHKIFHDKTVYELNRARNESAEFGSLNPEDQRERLRMEVYFNVKDLVEGRATEDEVFSAVFKLMDVYAGKPAK